MANIRIKDLSTDSALSAGDYVVVDSASEGSRKFDLGTELTSLKEDLNGWSDDTKTALLNCFAHVAWTDEHGQDYYDALEEALYAEEPKTLVSINAVYTQSGTVYDTDSLDSLKADLVVTALYSDSTTATVTPYTLSGALVKGTSTITVTYSDKTTTFDVVVSRREIIVYNGKGTSGTSIIDNANRALSEKISSTGMTSVAIQLQNLTDYTCSLKDATSDTTVSTQGNSLIPAQYVGGTSVGAYTAWAITTEKLYWTERVDNVYVYLIPESGYFRILFKNGTNDSTPITNLDETEIYINDVKYTLIEKSSGEFE